MLSWTILKSAAAVSAIAVLVGGYALYAQDQGGSGATGRSGLSLPSILAPRTTTSVQLAQADATRRVLEAGGEATDGRSRSLTPLESQARRNYLLDRAAAFKKIAEAWRVRSPATQFERLEFEGRADLYLAEVRRLEAEAKVLAGRRLQGERESFSTSSRGPTNVASSLSALSAPSSTARSSFAIQQSGESQAQRVATSTSVLNAIVPQRPRSAPCCRENNLAYGKRATAKSEETSSNNLAKHATDGDLATRWCAADGNTGSWLQVDLGRLTRVHAIRIHWEAIKSAYQYKVMMSADGRDWVTAVDASRNAKAAHSTSHSLDPGPTRYVRVEFIGNNRGFWGSIREVEVSDSELSPEPTKAWDLISSSCPSGEQRYWPMATDRENRFSESTTESFFDESDSGRFGNETTGDSSDDLFRD